MILLLKPAIVAFLMVLQQPPASEVTDGALEQWKQEAVAVAVAGAIAECLAEIRQLQEENATLEAQYVAVSSQYANEVAAHAETQAALDDCLANVDPDPDPDPDPEPGIDCQMPATWERGKISNEDVSVIVTGLDGSRQKLFCFSDQFGHHKLFPRSADGNFYIPQWWMNDLELGDHTITLRVWDENNQDLGDTFHDHKPVNVIIEIVVDPDPEPEDWPNPTNGVTFKIAGLAPAKTPPGSKYEVYYPETQTYELISTGHPLAVEQYRKVCVELWGDGLLQAWEQPRDWVYPAPGYVWDLKNEPPERDIQGTDIHAAAGARRGPPSSRGYEHLFD